MVHGYSAFEGNLYNYVLSKAEVLCMYIYYKSERSHLVYFYNATISKVSVFMDTN